MENSSLETGVILSVHSGSEIGWIYSVMFGECIRLLDESEITFLPRN